MRSSIKIIYLAFFLSGFVSLGYQIVWTRLLLLTFGVTTYSVVTVLAAFMAGLSLGSFLFGRRAITFKNPFRTFAYLELGIGLFAIFTPFIFEILNKLYPFLVQSYFDDASILVLKLILSGLVLLPATTLMGGTFPVLVSGLSRLSKEIPPVTSKLYSANTFGAVCGTLYTAFVAIEIFGLKAVVYSNVVIEVLIFLMILRISQKLTLGKIKLKQNRLGTVLSNKQKIVISLYGLLGALAMALEVLWTRLLTPTVGTYIYAFSAILATFLLGLTTGSFIYNKFLKRFGRTFILLGLAELGIAISAFWSILVTASGILPGIAWIQMLSVILPATICMGMMLPIITQLAKTHEAGDFVGQALASNSLGSILGPILAGFVLIPQLGSSRSVLLIASITALVATSLFLLEPIRRRSLQASLLPILSTGLGLILIMSIISGKDTIFRQRFIKHQMAINQDKNQVFLEDEVATVFAYSSEDFRDRGLIIDGVETTRLVPETKLIAHLPLFIHPNPKQVLIVALGMGTTFRSTLTHPVDQVEVVELVPSVVKTLPLFHNDAQAILADPRGKIVVNDGRHYVLITNKKYDVVTIDPPPPVNSAGTTVLYSQEFYQEIKKILNPGGVVQQWFLFDTTSTEAELKILIKTFVSEFNHTLVFTSPNNLGLSIVASDSPLTFNKEVIDEKLTHNLVFQDLQEWPNTPTTFSEFNNLFLGQKEVLKTLVTDVPVVTDDHPRTEYFLLKRLNTRSSWVNPKHMISQLQQ